MSPSTFHRVALLSALTIVLAAGPVRAAALGYAFTYQGSMSDGGMTPTGLYDFRCTLWDASAAGTQIGGTLTLDDKPVTAGIFAFDLDFGQSAYAGDARWLQVEVRQGASTGAYTLLPRQKLNPSPFAIGLSLPHYQSFSSASPLIQTLNTGTGSGAMFLAGGSTLNYGVIGFNGSTASQAAGVYGLESSTSGLVIGVKGEATASPSGTGIVGTGASTGAYLSATGPTSTGVFALGNGLGLQAQNTGTGSAILAIGNGSTRNNATVRIQNTQATAGMCQYATSVGSWANTHLQNDGTGECLWLQRSQAGNYITCFDTNEGYKFWVDDNGVTHTKVLEILGGADLSEKFDVGDSEVEVEPGMVVSIDPAHEGRLTLATTPYDHRVAGVVSGAGGVKPGMVMGQDGSIASGTRAIALTGRVYCRATAVNGPIQPGDLLTTSSVPGHCMRVDDPSRAQGAVLGKAMGALEKGEGLILVLVGLQ